MDENQNTGQNFNLLDPKPIYEEQKPPMLRRRFLLYIVAAILILFGINCTYRHYSIGQLPDDSTAYDPITLKPKKIGFLQAVKNFVFHSNNFLEGQNENRINILILGMGGPGHDGPYLTDTNIIVSVKPSNNEVAMISVPRDLGVEIEGEGLKKINYANSAGEVKESGQGGEFARQIFSKTFNLDIPYYIRIDFKAFQEIIDTLGGINVNIPRAFTDTAFPGPNESYQTISFDAGPQVMLGERALQYARSRHGSNGEGSDFARSKRQQQILMALKEKMLSIGTYTNPIKIEKIFQSLANHVATNLDFGQMMYLGSIARDIDGAIKNLVLDDSDNGFLISSNTVAAGFTLLPRTGNFDEINQAVADVFLLPVQTSTQTSAQPPRQTASSAVAIIPPQNNEPIFPSVRIEIQNGTWQVGLASRMQNKLKEQGFSVNKIGNAVKRPILKTSIYLITSDLNPEAVNNLKTAVSAEISNTFPEWLTAKYDNPSTQENESGPKYQADTDILVILGEDAKKN